MKLKKQSLRLGSALCTFLMVSLMLLLCGIPEANAQTPQQIAKKALAATVLLVMEDNRGKPLGLGSGFFVDTNLIATNFHVIKGATRGTAKRVGQETEYTIESFIKKDEKHDLAILQVSAPDVQSLPLGDSTAVEIGDTVYVAGNPKGFFEGTFSDGIISAIRGDSTSKRLQMTAPVSSGSSGGPVLNGRGEVIGVSFATFRGGQNLNFAIPSKYLKELLTQFGSPKPSSSRKQSTHDELHSDKEALAEYDKAIRLNPNDAEAYLNRGAAKNKLGQYFAAITDFDTAIRIKPDYADAYYSRGVAKDKLDQHNAAVDDYNTAIRLKPDLAQDYLNRGNVKYELGLYSSAIDDYDTAIRINFNYADAYYNRGNAKADLGRYPAAIKDYDTAIQLKPDYVEVYYNRGNAKTSLEQYPAAIKDYDTAIRLKSDYTEAYLNRGIAKVGSGQHAAAVNDYEIAIVLKPDYAGAYFHRGMVKHHLGQYATAINDYDTAIQLNPDYAEAYNGRGAAKDKLEQHFAAITDFDIAIQLKSDYAAAYYNRGIAKDKLGQPSAAIKDFDTAIQLKPNIVYLLNPDTVNTYYKRGIAKASSGQHNAAINDFDAVIRLKPDYAEAYLNRGIAKNKLGQHSTAIKDFDTAIQLKPNIAKQLKHNHSKIYYERGNAKVESGEYNAAIKDYDTTIRINHDYAEAYLKRGVAKDKLGQHFAAIKDYDTAIQLKFDYADAYYNRGVAKDNLGQHNAAFNDFDTAIQLAPDPLKARYYRKHHLNSKFVKKVLAATVRFEGSNTSGFFVSTNRIATDSPQQGVAKRVGQVTKYYTIKDTINYSSHNDVAILILQVSDLDVQPLPVGDSNMVEVGSRVYIASNPKGSLGGSFVAGNIISVRINSKNFGVGKKFDILVDSRWIPRGYPYFRPGGPVLNNRGEVIGIATHYQKASRWISATSSKYLKEWLSQ